MPVQDKIALTSNDARAEDASSSDLVLVAVETPRLAPMASGKYVITHGVDNSRNLRGGWGLCIGSLCL